MSSVTSTTTTGQFVVTNQLDPNGASATFTIESPLSYRLSESQPVVEFGQSIGFTYSITNNSDQPVTFELAPTNFTVTNNGGTVWESDPGPPPQQRRVRLCSQVNRSPKRRPGTV